MLISLGIALAIFTFLGTVLILGVGLWDLYLSHYKEPRSEVKLLPEEAISLPEFSGGNNAINHKAHWSGAANLKIVNSGTKGAYIQSFTHELAGLRKEGQETEPTDAEIVVNEHRPSWVGTEIEPGSSTRYRAHVKIKAENDIEPFVNYDYAVIDHTIGLEDNKGSYEVTHTTEMQLTGPELAIESWEDHLKEQE